MAKYPLIIVCVISGALVGYLFYAESVWGPEMRGSIVNVLAPTAEEELSLERFTLYGVGLPGLWFTIVGATAFVVQGRYRGRGRRRMRFGWIAVVLICVVGLVWAARVFLEFCFLWD